MSSDLTIPSDLQYTKTHEWARIDDEGDVVIGITQHAVDLLGDLVFVELPEIGAEIGAGGEAGVVESVKAASDIYAPITGEVIAVNEALTTTPELLNSDPYGDGWIYKLRPDDESELSELLDSEAYAEVVAEDH